MSGNYRAPKGASLNSIETAKTFLCGGDASPIRDVEDLVKENGNLFVCVCITLLIYLTPLADKNHMQEQIIQIVLVKNILPCSEN